MIEHGRGGQPGQGGGLYDYDLAGLSMHKRIYTPLASHSHRNSDMGYSFFHIVHRLSAIRRRSSQRSSGRPSGTTPAEQPSSTGFTTTREVPQAAAISCHNSDESRERASNSGTQIRRAV